MRCSAAPRQAEYMTINYSRQVKHITCLLFLFG